MGMNMVTTVMAFSVSAFFVLFIFVRLLCARIHLRTAAADAAAAHAALAGAVKVKGVLPVAMDDAAAIGGVVSLALRERLELRWTASGSDEVCLATATPAELATKALP